MSDPNPLAERDQMLPYVLVATWIRDEAAHNDWTRVDYLQYQLRWLLFWLVPLVGTCIWLASPDWLSGVKYGPVAAVDPLETHLFLYGVLIFGGLGGTLSAILALASASTKKRIPNQVSDAKVTLLRPILGAALGLIAYALLRAGMISFIDLSPALALSVSFAAGFSEKFVVGRIESMSSEKPTATANELQTPKT
jgi:hypothetical protein